MNGNPIGDYLDIVFYFMVGAWILFSGSYAVYRRKHRSVDFPNVPILLSYYTDGSNLLPVKKGTIGKLHFSAIAALNFFNQTGKPQSALLYIVELPFASSIHILGIPRRTGAQQLNPAHGNSIMEKVDLEGDYNDYFELFCEKGMQEEARYVLNPKAMLFTLEFCQSQNWEIVDNELFFVLASGMKPDDNDPTPLEDDIVKFVGEIRPAIAKPLTEKEQAALTSYGEDRRTDLKCPICSRILVNKETYFICQNGHGVLLTGKELQKIKDRLHKLPVDKVAVSDRASKLTCPSCGRAMERVPFGGGSTIIDSCPNCPYRWIDASDSKPS